MSFNKFPAFKVKAGTVKAAQKKDASRSAGGRLRSTRPKMQILQNGRSMHPHHKEVRT
ncbi:hypothetical protein GN277_15190 [Lachnospiraceae bacterium WCA-9-b2]|jgi:hypothetical protein|uniref:Uncharacterized protein n=1 Tax=Sporofaciens musculi TaxID=2681861 RepID=A0A7X3SJQ7_9FIRM|nr:hypothetical protein [Sporofaciens musculi]MXP76677.1 hypothetical protein [Sporofaciens musculi]